MPIKPDWIQEQQVSAEQMILGAIMIDDSRMEEIRNIITADMFVLPVDKAAFIAACEIHDEGKEVDPVILTRRLNDKNIGWTSKYAKELMDYTLTSADVIFHSRILKQEYMRDELLTLADTLRDNLVSGSEPEEMKVYCADFLEKMTESDDRSGTFSQSKAVEETLQSINEISEGKKLPALPSGYAELDELLGGGFQRNGFYILAARPGHGKTTVALNIARRVCESGKKVLFISLEMDKEQLIVRFMASKIGDMGPTQILNKQFPDWRWDDITNASKEIEKWNIHYNKSNYLNVSEIKQLAKSNNVDLVIIDYLGLIESENENGKLYEEVTKTSKKLKQMARNIGCPILCLAQMNRESEKRADKKPMLSDLRDSGSIEQDADAVIFNWTPDDKEWYASDGVDSDPLTLVIAKNRHGGLGNVELDWYKKSGRIVEAN